MSFGSPWFTLPEFTYHKPKTLKEALELLDKYGEEAKVMAGGVGLLAFMKERLMAPSHVIDLKGVPELGQAIYKEGEGLTIGATVTLNELARYGPLKKFGALHDAVRDIADPIIRNRATLVGNLCEAIPWVDTPPALIALGAEVEIRSLKGERRVPVKDFIKGPVEIDLEPGELVTAVHVPEPRRNSRSRFIKYNTGSEFALVSVAANVVMDGGRVRDVSLVYGAVSSTPQVAVKAADALKSAEKPWEVLDEVGRIASEEVEAVSDVLASEEYRRHLIRVLTLRVLREVMG